MQVVGSAELETAFVITVDDFADYLVDGDRPLFSPNDVGDCPVRATRPAR